MLQRVGVVVVGDGVTGLTVGAGVGRELIGKRVGGVNIAKIQTVISVYSFRTFK